MRSAAPFLLLFLCSSPAIGQEWLEASAPREDDAGAGVPPELLVLQDELRGLKDLVLSLRAEEVERRQALRIMESRLRDGEGEAERQRRSLEGLEEMVVRLREEWRSGGGRTEVDGRLLTELNSDLRRKVEELEEQSKGGRWKSHKLHHFSSQVFMLASCLSENRIRNYH